MKTIITLFTLVLSFQALAQDSDVMSYSERDAYVEKAAKQERRSLYIAGHDYVDSTITYPNKEALDEYFSADERYESYLDSHEVSQVYLCFHSSKCRVYHIATSSEYWGGYGVEGTFILLDITRRSHERLSHTIYSE
jgi:hypothetical protein